MNPLSLPDLNFPPIEPRFRNGEAGVMQIFDAVRKKFVVLSPEEWVRQHLIHYMMQHKQVPLSMISVEKQLLLNGTRKRTDVVVFNSSLKPLIIAECKAPAVQLDQKAINQILRYNLTLDVPYLFITNGNRHICLRIGQGEAQILNSFPEYGLLTVL